MEDNKLAKISLGINALLIIAVIFLFVKMPSGAGGEGDDIDSSKVEFTDENPARIAYFSNDSLNKKCQFVLDVQEDAEAISIDAQNKIKSKENEIIATQKKWQDKGDLLEREYIQAQEEMGRLQEEYLGLQQQLQNDVAIKTEKLMMTMYNRMSIYATGFCEKNDIDVLMGYQLGGQIYYMSPDMDVTSQFINYSNKEYNSTFEEATPEAGED